MRAGGVFHPRFFYDPRRVTKSSELVELKIYNLSEDQPEWSPGEGFSVGTDELIWHGFGRFQPNKDWRARTRGIHYDYTAIHAIRIQIPIGENLVGAVYDDEKGRYVEYGQDPKFRKDQRVEVVQGPVKGFEITEGESLYIRNAEQSQNLWHYNLLCDTKTGD